MTTAGQTERPATNRINEAVAKPDINTTNRTYEGVSATTMTGMATGPEFFEYAAVTSPASKSRLESRLESAAYLEIIPGGADRRGSGDRVDDRVGDRVGVRVGDSDGDSDGEQKMGRLKRIGPAYGGYWEVLQ